MKSMKKAVTKVQNGHENLKVNKRGEKAETV